MQQNQVAEISGVKHPDNSKTVGDFFFVIISLVTWSCKYLTNSLLK